MFIVQYLCPDIIREGWFAATDNAVCMPTEIKKKSFKNNGLNAKENTLLLRFAMMAFWGSAKCMIALSRACPADRDYVAGRQ
ncbi:hypothetical protein KIH13_24300 [Pseudomonas viridiflava]|nr:hypothetical protein KIH13_24300 [Pseudomonas viridiflava]